MTVSFSDPSVKTTLSDLFAKRQLVRPSPHEPDLVHLIRAIASLGGVEGMDGFAPTQKLMGLIGPARHMVFVLLDGLGMNLVQRLPRDSFIVSRLQGQIHATCPSTTACALTSVATGQWPAQHAVTGWFTHLAELGITSTLLPFSERYTHQPLGKRGLSVQEVLPVAAFYPRMVHRPLTFMPTQISNTAYATYSRGYTPVNGYHSFIEATDQIIAHVRAADEPSYTHLYIPDIDTLCHKRGVDHPSVIDLIMQIDAQVSRLANALAGRARIIVSADHGLIDVALHEHMPIFDGDPVLEMLEAPPSGDARLPIFHVREGRREAFVELFNERFAKSMILLETAEAERMELFGPAPMSPIARRRFGDFVGIAFRPATLLYHPPSAPAQNPREPYLAQHAGLSPNEMLVPLVLA